jgi:hypothetical protein
VRRAFAVALLLACLALALPSQAAATFHLMKIREVSFGNSTCPECGYVQLQMFAAGQNQVSGHVLKVYGPNGSPTPFTLDANVPNSQSQRRILIGDVSVTEADFRFPGLDAALDPTGGAVCFDVVDCVAWGSFTPGPPLPSPVGHPAPALVPETMLERSIARGCPTLLESVDDTNDSAADFASQPASASPLTNSDTPPETQCSSGAAPDTTIDSGPKKKTTKKKATFRFSSDTAGATFECKLDSKLYEPCTSPTVIKRIKRGKHRFFVRAVANGKTDPTPASYRWKRIRPS